MNAYGAGEVACIRIDGRRVGPGEPPFIVAELSGNHNGDLGRALALIDAAHAAGADAVKLQTYTADTLTIDCDGPQFRIERGPWAGQRLYDLYASAHTPWDWHEALFDRARSLGLSIFSTPFDPSSVGLPRAVPAASLQDRLLRGGGPAADRMHRRHRAAADPVDRACDVRGGRRGHCRRGLRRRNSLKESRHCEEAHADEAIRSSGAVFWIATPLRGSR